MMTLASQLPVNDVLLRFCDRDPCADMMAETTHLQEFQFCAPRLIAYDQPGALSGSAPLMSNPLWSRTGTQYSWLHIAPVIVRHAAPHLRNIMIPQFIVVSMSFVTFFVPPEDLSNRLDVSINLILATITLRLIIAEQIPKVAYPTWLGDYCLQSLFFLAFIVLENICASTNQLTAETECPFRVSLLLSWILFNAHASWYALRYVRRRRHYCSVTESLFRDFACRNHELEFSDEQVDIKELEASLLSFCARSKVSLGN